ncbi:hypothetical protein Misp03_35360 [Microbispora sp. NBRC 16548]|nr:hypothetical protein Misp03_35360 [Microbispora sp. NBRC 16548]
MIGGRVFDSSGLVAFGVGSPYAQAAVWSSVEENLVIVVPAPALVAALAQIPDDRWDIITALLNLPITVITDLTRGTAPGIADTLRAAAGNHAPAGVTAAAVVHAARDRGWPVLTSQPQPLRALWPRVPVEPLP